MTPAEADEVLALLDSGVVLRVPFITTLFPDATPQESTLRRAGEAYEFTTVYTEFAAGHGFRTGMLEHELLSRERLQPLLSSAKREDCALER